MSAPQVVQGTCRVVLGERFSPGETELRGAEEAAAAGQGLGTATVTLASGSDQPRGTVVAFRNLR